MLYTSPHDVQRNAILAAVRDPTVAAVAGVVPATWASATSPRVLSGDAAGYLAGLHRGRLPAVEVFQAADQWVRQAANGGTILTEWVLRAHAPDLTKHAAESRCRAILLASLAALRAVEYLAEGSEEFDTMQHGPLGHNLAVRIALAHTFCRATYELTSRSTYRRPGGVDLFVRTTDPLATYLRP